MTEPPAQSVVVWRLPSGKWNCARRDDEDGWFFPGTSLGFTWSVIQNFLQYATTYEVYSVETP